MLFTHNFWFIATACECVRCAFFYLCDQPIRSFSHMINMLHSVHGICSEKGLGFHQQQKKMRAVSVNRFWFYPNTNILGSFSFHLKAVTENHEKIWVDRSFVRNVGTMLATVVMKNVFDFSQSIMSLICDRKNPVGAAHGTRRQSAKLCKWVLLPMPG